MSWLSRFFKKPTRQANYEQDANAWVDPLNPRGDGTLQEGDPMFEVFKRIMATGQAEVTTVDDSGNIISSESFPTKGKS